MNTNALLMEGLTCSFTVPGTELQVLEEINLQVRQGEFVSLLGPSGSGKSTLLKVAAGLVRPNRGKVIIEGEPVVGQIRKTGYMPQKDLLLPWKTLVQNASLPLLADGVSRQEARRRVEELLPVFGLAGFENAYPHQLSGGMKQRAALLRTLMIESKILLLDEPFAALDAITREKMREWLLQIWEQFKKSVLFVTHSLEEAIFLSDRVYVITRRPGRICLDKKISLPRPRHQEQITSPLFISYRQELMKALQ